MTYPALIIAVALAAVTLSSPMAVAKNSAGACPPGLAKKNPPCIPPGQAKKLYSVGDRLPNSGYYVISDPSKYRLPRLGRGESYYRVGNTVFRVNRETREILQLFEAVGAVLN